MIESINIKPTQPIIQPVEENGKNLKHRCLWQGDV